jgi:hypothetical protein
MQDKSPRKPRMIRKQVFITPEQNRRLKERAALSGVAEAELIRAGIDLRLEQADASTKGDWKEAWRQAAGMWKDYDAADQIVSKRRARLRKRRELRRSSGSVE